jgi:glucose uptake protein
MILPSTYLVTLLLVILSMLCWGSWATTFKLTGKWRYELYYFDYAIGLAIASLIAAFTFGTLGFDGFSFMDDFIHASKKQDLYGFIGGAVFNLGNMLILAAVPECGMAVAIPIGLGVALMVGSVWNFFLRPGMNAALLFAGCAIVLVAVILAISAYRLFKFSQIDELVRTGQQKSTRKTVSVKGATVAAFGGVFVGSYFPLIGLAMQGEAGLGPYSVGVLFAIGLVFSTFVFNLILMNLPIAGAPVEIFDYFKGTLRQHLLGLLGGVIWYVGMVAGYVAAAAEGTANIGPALAYALTQGAVVIAALWGLLYWKEFKDADGRVKAILFVTLALFVCGIGLVSFSPVLSRG